jgi:acyl carrier protein
MDKTNKINKILADNLKISLDQAEQNLTMQDVNDWDSLSHMNLIVAIEDEFQIQLTGDEIAEMISLEKIREIVQKHL